MAPILVCIEQLVDHTALRIYSRPSLDYDLALVPQLQRFIGWERRTAVAVKQTDNMQILIFKKRDLSILQWFFAYSIDDRNLSHM